MWKTSKTFKKIVCKNMTKLKSQNITIGVGRMGQILPKINKISANLNIKNKTGEVKFLVEQEKKLKKSEQK